MKKAISYILPGLFLVIILAGAGFAYTELTKTYAPPEPVSTLLVPETTETTGTAALPGNDTENTAPTETEPEETEPEETEPPEKEPIPERDPAPDFTVQDMEGNTVSLSDYAGKPVVVNFWATWCDPCQYEMPYFETAWQTYGEDVTFIMLNMGETFDDTMEDVESFIADSGYTFPVYIDTQADAAIKYGINSFPRTLLVDANGGVAAGYMGMIPEETLVYGIEALLAEME